MITAAGAPRLHSLAAIIFLFALPAAALATRTQYIQTPDVVLSIAAAGAVDCVEAWSSDDFGQSWLPRSVERDSPAAIRILGLGDGRHDLYLVLHNAAGASAEEPCPGAAPHTTLIVDTIAPLLQLGAVRVQPGANDAPELLGRLTLIEENLADGAVRVFFRLRTDEPWRDGGPLRITEGQFRWPLPADAAAEIDLRVVATDRAGNQSMDELTQLHVPHSSAVVAAPQPANATRKQTLLAAGADPPAQRPPARASTPEPPPSAAMDGARTPASQPAPAQRRLRELAAEFAAQGRYDLAAARLNDALAAAPGDLDLLLDLAGALYGAGRYDEAQQRYENVLAAAADRPAALEGLALVAASQRRYSVAREHLERLLKLQPDSARNWLRYGDIAYRMGESERARDAWRRVQSLPATDAALRDSAARRLKLLGSTGN